MAILIISAIIGLLLASRKKTQPDPGNGNGNGNGNGAWETSGYFLKPAFVDTAPRTQIVYPADKWSIKGNEFWYEFTYSDGTLMYKTPMVIAFDKKQSTIYPEALERLKEFWAIPSDALKQLAMFEFNNNQDNWHQYGTRLGPSIKYNNLRDLVNLVLFLRKEPLLFDGINFELVYYKDVPGQPTPYCTSEDKDGQQRAWYKNFDGSRRIISCTIGWKDKVYPYNPVNWSLYASGAWDPAKRSGSAIPFSGKGVIVPNNTGGDGTVPGNGAGSGNPVQVPKGGTTPLQTYNQQNSSAGPAVGRSARHLRKMFLKK